MLLIYENLKQLTGINEDLQHISKYTVTAPYKVESALTRLMNYIVLSERNNLVKYQC
jgi:hypothetical protein